MSRETTPTRSVMRDVGIIGGGVGGTQLGLFLRQHGVSATIYSAKTPAEHLAARITNVVCRSGTTRARERALGVDFWDAAAPDLQQFVVAVNGPRPLTFSGALNPPTHVVDMRIYWARLLEEFAKRGGSLVYRTLEAGDVEELSRRHDLVVVASGRGALSHLFPRLPEHSPFQNPQRVVLAALFRGIAYPKPLAFQAIVNRGHGEILEFPLFSFEPGLTALGIEAAPGGAFAVLSRFHRSRFDEQRSEFEATVLALLRDYAPSVYVRIDTTRFAVARPLDIGYVAITPIVRRGYARLSNGRTVLALGDAHITMDPVTGQGANKASHDAVVVGAAICESTVFDEDFCARVSQRMCEYSLPVSDACNARLMPPAQHVMDLLAAAAQHQAVADFYTASFNDPDRFWHIASRPERTEVIKKHLIAGTLSATPLEWDAIVALANAEAVTR
jgi:2-polyprenyl-6-methoxyphenol hydroxylase-like FAD-dependent oxidoreductase